MLTGKQTLEISDLYLSTISLSEAKPHLPGFWVNSLVLLYQSGTVTCVQNFWPCPRISVLGKVPDVLAFLAFPPGIAAVRG